MNEWYLNNRLRYRTCTDQQTLADKVLAECDRMRDQVQEITVLNKREVDHKLEEKLLDIKFAKDEILKQRKEVVIEIQNLEVYNERIMDALANLKESALKICKKCLIIREGRLGIDLVSIDVQ